MFSYGGVSILYDAGGVGGRKAARTDTEFFWVAASVLYMALKTQVTYYG